jgi:hypothetical protein
LVHEAKRLEILEVQSMTNDPYREIGMDQPQYNPIPEAPMPRTPRTRDPIKLAGVTIEAVDQIGESCAAEIETAAQAVTDAADKVAGNLRDLAAAVREHTKIAGEHVGQFCGKATTVIEGLRALQQRLDAGEPKKGNGSD